MVKFLKSLREIIRVWYNTPVKKKPEVQTMEEQANSNINLGFLFKVLPGIQYHTLHRLFAVHSFVEAMKPMLEKSESIQAEDVYRIIKSLYFPLLQRGVRSSDAVALYKATRGISKLLEGDPNAWKTEYDKWEIKD